MVEGILPYAKSRFSKFSKTRMFLRVKHMCFWRFCSYIKGGCVHGIEDCKAQKWKLCFRRVFYKGSEEISELPSKAEYPSKMECKRRFLSIDIGIDAFFVSSFANGGLFIG